MNVFNRLKAIRKYRNLTQEDIAEWFNISSASYGRKEKGIEGGLGLEEIQTILDKTEIDSRFLFGRLDNIVDADLKLRGGKSESAMESLQREMKEIKEKVSPITKLDPVAERVIVNQALRDLVELVQFWDATQIRRFTDMAYSYIQGRRSVKEEDYEKKKNVG
jgi:transcriptional regulator with XRE-family HTH domain